MELVFKSKAECEREIDPLTGDAWFLKCGEECKNCKHRLVNYGDNGNQKLCPHCRRMTYGVCDSGNWHPASYWATKGEARWVD